MKRIALALAGGLLIAVIYVLQQSDFLYLITRHNFSDTTHFIFNRMVRILGNDFGMLMVIISIFPERKVLRLAIFIQLLDALVFFPMYLAFKLPAEGTSELSSPFLSQFHRLIVNPTLMILLIPAIMYQKLGSVKRGLKS